MNAYALLVSQLADSGAKIIVLPEKLVGLTNEYDAEAVDILRTAAARRKVYIVAGFNRLGSTPLRNVAVVISPDGSIVGDEKA